MDVFQKCLSIAKDQWHTRWICPLLLLADAGLTALIVWKVPYTEIDWTAYVEQVTQYLAGERDYTKIQGGTGPLVYPAAHVYIYQVLYRFTDQGTNIPFAQIIFGVLYLMTLAVVMACYRNAKIPPYVFPMLILSKRMHSIFTLRLFNDCFAIFFFFLAIYCYQKRWWIMGSAIYSIGLGVKMSLLLALPAVGTVLLQAIGASDAIGHASLIVLIQVLLSLPFTLHNPQGYLSRAFEFTRQFFFKWTVNWRFVGEETFLSKQFALTLLAAHVSLLVLFATTRWLKPSKQTLPAIIGSIFNPPSEAKQAEISARVTPRFILTTILSANAIGMLCARSLHYQFYSWIVWATPALLWRAGYHPILQYALWGAQEYAWNVFPSTNFSSIVVVQVLAATVAGVWYGTRKETTDAPVKKHQHVE
ncbi:mannosyltransferase [Aureobasidium pullulans]|nr:mannosyltransferase [Aureobasidium pullulans]